MTLFEKVHLATKQFILNAKSPWRFFILWAFVSMSAPVSIGVPIELFWSDDVTLKSLFIIWGIPFFIIWLEVVSLFYSPELRFWAIHRCFQKPEASGLDIDKIKSRHIEWLDHISIELFFLVFSAVIILMIIGVIGGLVILFL